MKWNSLVNAKKHNNLLNVIILKVNTHTHTHTHTHTLTHTHTHTHTHTTTHTEFIIGRELPALQDTYHTRCLRKAGMILKDCYHSAFRLFTPLPSGRRYRSIRSRTRRLENSFYPRAIR